METEIKNIFARYIDHYYQENQRVKIKNSKPLNFLTKIKVICIGVPAGVDIKSGEIVSGSLYGSWKGLNFKKILESELTSQYLWLVTQGKIILRTNQRRY